MDVRSIPAASTRQAPWPGERYGSARAARRHVPQSCVRLRVCVPSLQGGLSWLREWTLARSAAARRAATAACACFEVPPPEQRRRSIAARRRRRRPCLACLGRRWHDICRSITRDRACRRHDRRSRACLRTRRRCHSLPPQWLVAELAVPSRGNGVWYDCLWHRAARQKARSAEPSASPQPPTAPACSVLASDDGCAADRRHNRQFEGQLSLLLRLASCMSPATRPAQCCNPRRSSHRLCNPSATSVDGSCPSYR